MMTRNWVIITIILSLLLTAGCAMKRANITALSQAQQNYYNALHRELQTKQEMLATGLDEQLKADRVRELNLLDWERDLQKAETLLQVDANVTGNKKLLLMKLAELNLKASDELSKKSLDQSRKDAILKLYEKLMSAVEQLKKNNEVILAYLGAGDEKFALRSLDIEGIVRAVSGICDVQEELGQIEKRSDEDRTKESEKLRKSLERTQDLLIKAFNKK